MRTEAARSSTGNENRAAANNKHGDNPENTNYKKR
jgi:hypothetical protein